MSKKVFIPLEFKRLFDDDWREAAVYGGRYSLKSHTVARFLLIKARLNKTRIGCFREFQNSIADSSHQLLADLIKQYELYDFKVTDNSIINSVNGSDFIFKGLHRNEQSVKSIEGIDIAWIEEAQTVSESSIEVLTPTVRKNKAKLIYTYNRVEEEDPVHKRLVIEGRPNTLIIKTDYLIAEKYGYLPEVIKAEIEDDKSKRPDLYKHKWLGEPQQLLNERIYKDWIKIDEIPPEARLERRYLDFGYSIDESALGEIYYFNGAYIVRENLYQKGMSNKQLADVILNLPEPRTLVIADSAEPKSIDELRSYGVQVLPCEKGKDSVEYGIQTVKAQKMMVTKDSPNIWKEYLNYLWLVDKDGVIVRKEDPKCKNHHMAGIRYSMTSLVPIQRRKEFIKHLPNPFPHEKTNIAL